MINSGLLHFRYVWSVCRHFRLRQKTLGAYFSFRQIENPIAVNISCRSFVAALLAASLTIGPSQAVFAEAPVVDDSENFELFEQQAARKAPDEFRPAHTTQETDHLNTPLAHEDHTDASLTKTEQQVKLLNTIQNLQQEVQELRGQLEVQAHELKRLHDQQIEFYKDLDGRTRAGQPVSQKKSVPTDLNTTSTLNPTTSQSANTPPATTTLNTIDLKDEKSAYMTAYAFVNNKQFDEALPAMETFISHYPDGGYTANAHYWAGELYMVRKQYTEAIQHFEAVLQKFPSSSKSSACLLKIGYALAASGDIQQAKQKLQHVIQQYPDTHAAQLAVAKLDSLGHP